MSSNQMSRMKNELENIHSELHERNTENEGLKRKLSEVGERACQCENRNAYLEM